MRQHRFAFILLALFATTLFLPALLRREVFGLRDHFDYFQPLRWFTAQELKAGHLPLWNPYSASGEPWLANPQTGVFYPPSWLFLVLPFATAYMLFLLLHMVILGWGAYLLFVRRAPPGAAMLGAAALMFSGPVLSLLDVSNNFATLAWIPLALWCACEGAWKRGALVLTLAFLGAEPFFALLAALLYAIVRRHRDVLWTALLTVGLSAIQLFPFLEFVRHSDRAAGGMDDALILRDSMTLGDWLHVALPSAAPLTQQFIPIVFMGVVVVLLALIGLTTIRKRRDVAGWLALLVAAIALSTGPSWLTHLPLTLFRYPARLMPFGALAVAGLAVAGWQRIRAERRWLDLLVMLAIVAELLMRARPLLGTRPFRTDVVPYDRAMGTTAKVFRFGEVDPQERPAWMSGYLNLYDRRFDVFTAAPLASAPYVRMYRELLRKPTFQTVAYAGAGFILTRNELPLPWYPTGGAGHVRVYRNLEAFPMAAHFAPGSPAMRRASWTLDTSSARVEVNAPSDGIVVLRQQAAPGWRVTVDGKPAASLVIDGIFRGVNVTRGAHRIVWKYRPASLTAGAATTFLTLLATLFFSFVKRSRARKTEKLFSSCPSNLE